MGCNTSQEQMGAVHDENKSSGVMKNGKLLNGNQKITNNKNDNILLVEEYGQSEEFAATKIQAAFRGHKTRIAMKNSDTDSNSQSKVAVSSTGQSKSALAELEAEFDPNDKDLCDAAVKIQATFRGHLQRKLAAAGDKDEVDVDIQEITKKVAEELDIDLSDPELNKAATKIQASFRGHQIRKQV